MTFEGKVVAITGAAGGVGLSLCRYFIDEGAKVAAIDRKPSVETLASDLKAPPKAFFSVIADISETAQVDRAFASLADALGARRHSRQQRGRLRLQVLRAHRPGRLAP